MIGLKVTVGANRFKQIAERLETEAAELVSETMDHIVENVETAMELPKFGNVYGNHQASEPGEPPAIDTGDLVDSARKSMESPTSGVIEYTSHAAAMEYGTVHVEPRPFLRPAVDSERPRFRRAVQKMLRKKP